MLKKLRPLKFGTILFISIFLTLGFSISLQSLLAAWTAPTATPPINNVYDFTVSGITFAMGGLRASDPSFLLGNVGIGTTSDILPSHNAKLLIQATSTGEGLRIISSAGWSPLVVMNNTDTADLFRVKENGNVGIGVSPLQKLDVNGNMRLRGTPNCSGKLYTNASGDVLCGTDNGGSGTVTLVATNNGLTGGTITTSGTIGLDTGLISSCTNSTSNKIYWNGSRLACGTDQTGAGGITGGGTNTIDYLTKWSTAGSVITNSLISEKWGNVGIGGNSATEKLAVAGGILATGQITTTTKINSPSYCDAFGANCKAITAMGGGITTEDFLFKSQHFKISCTDNGGTVLNDGGGDFCKIGGGACSSGWYRYGAWQATSPHTCYNAYGNSSCTTGSHTWSNNNFVESCTYCTNYSDGCKSKSTCYAYITQIGCY